MPAVDQFASTGAVGRPFVRCRRVRSLPSLVAPAVVASVLLLACSDGDDAAPASTEPTASIPESVATSDGATPASSPPIATTSPSTTSTTTTTTTAAPTTSTTIDPNSVAHAFPVDAAVNASFTPQAHANYRATDIFSSADCGTTLVSPVTGIVDEVLPDRYDRAVVDPATRGGNAVSIIGDDGVRYYMAHFQLIDAGIVPGLRVTAGDRLGEMGMTGRAGACHVHFGLSLPCNNGDWWVRRGVIWPDEYLDAWKAGENRSPRAKLEAWFAEYPDACRSVDDTPYPVS